MQEPEPGTVLNKINRVLNLGYDLRRRLEVVAAAEQIDATALGRRIVEAGVSAREQARQAGDE